MRLPLQHPPPPQWAAPARCEHLARLARASIGLPLGPAAALVASTRSRGRHGNALQWHLGLDAHDGSALPDWEGRIEIKLVTVWRAGGRIACDKLKVCDATIDPWAKLANVLFVFADRMTRVVVGHVFFRLEGAAGDRLARSWHVDAHFDAPDLFIESRDSASASAPAYYVSARWLLDHVIPAELPGVLEGARATRGTPLALAIAGPQRRCPRCGAPLRWDDARVAAAGWAEAHHGLPLAGPCATAEHVVIDGARLPAAAALSPAERDATLEGRVDATRLSRLVERVVEPDDHGHG
jgi:hypothetical protein